MVFVCVCMVFVCFCMVFVVDGSQGETSISTIAPQDREARPPIFLRLLHDAPKIVIRIGRIRS